jgi:pyruvate formate lyase activating enzyme
MIGRIHSIQTMGTVDGPGVRFVVFLQGCDWRCAYCHNPDTWKKSEGTEIEAVELAKNAARYRAYYGKQPGITVSGGEALCQMEFVTELFRECKKNGFHTALDTSGSCLDLWNEDSGENCETMNSSAKQRLKELLEVTDLCLLDIKFTTEVEYNKYTGSSLYHVMEFLKLLEQYQIKTWIRQVLVPGLHDNEENLKRLCQITNQFTIIEKVEFLPFRKLCVEKYETLGIPFRFECYPECSEIIRRKAEDYYCSICGL